MRNNFHSTRVEWLTYVTVGAVVSFGLLEILKNDTSAISGVLEDAGVRTLV